MATNRMVSSGTSSFSSRSPTRYQTRLLRVGQQARVQLRPPDHGDSHGLRRPAGSRLGRAVSGYEADRRGNLVPLSTDQFPHAPFPEYSSGHSNFSAAGAGSSGSSPGAIGSGGSVTLRAGSSRVEPGAVPSGDINLSWATFSDAADQAGISRRYGGIQFEQGDLDARATGRLAARMAWKKAQEYWEGR